MIVKAKYNLFFSISVCLLVALVGCTPAKMTKNGADARGAPQSYTALAANYLKDGKPNYKTDDLLEILRAGKAFHDAGMWQLSNEAFDLAHEKLSWKEDTVDTPEEVANLIGTTITNGALGSYQGRIFEGGLISYYQAINTLMLGDENNARVEFNRLEVRQRNAESQLQAYASTVESEADENLKKNEDKKTKTSLDEVKTDTEAGLSKLPDGLDDSHIRNASGDILSAVFRATSQARQDKSTWMIDQTLLAAEGSVVTADARDLVGALRVEAKSRKAQLSNKVIVVYEDGRGPGFKEFRVDLPVFIATQKVLYSGFALPSFENGTEALGGLSFKETGVQTAVVTDLNRLAGLEFKKSYSGVVAKAVVSAVLKTAAQYAVNAEIDKKTKDKPLAGLLLKIGTAAVQYQLTKADLRAWDNLPNTIQMAIIDRPENGQLTILGLNGLPIQTVTLAANGNTLVLVRASPVVAQPAVYVTRLGFTPGGTSVASR